jgi:hypothetical protein
MKKILTFENISKYTFSLLALAGLYYGLDKRLSMFEQKLDYYISSATIDSRRAELLFVELNKTDKDLENKYNNLNVTLASIKAILPKQITLENE